MHREDGGECGVSSLDVLHLGRSRGGRSRGGGSRDGLRCGTLRFDSMRDVEPVAASSSSFSELLTTWSFSMPSSSISAFAFAAFAAFVSRASISAFAFAFTAFAAFVSNATFAFALALACLNTSTLGGLFPAAVRTWPKAKHAHECSQREG